MAFKTQYSNFKYKVIYFGLFNAPTSFKSYIKKTLTKKLDFIMIISLDNIVIYTNETNYIYFV